MLVLPRSVGEARRPAINLRERLALALAESIYIARLMCRVTDMNDLIDIIDVPWFERVVAPGASAVRSACSLGPRLVTRAVRARGSVLAGGMLLIRVGEIATLGAVMLGLSASTVGTMRPASAVAPVIVASFTPTGCMLGPTMARMMTTDEVAMPIQYGLRMSSTGRLYTCAQPGLAIPAPTRAAPHLAGQVILVELSQEWLYAYQNGRLVLASPVSSGRPDLRTPTGTFTIQQKLADSMFTSPWPVGSPYYYTPLHVNYGLLFLTGGFYIHDAPWRTTYGPGSEDPHLAPNGTTETGSHGCIEMPTSMAAQLYAWTHLGATVIIQA